MADRVEIQICEEMISIAQLNEKLRLFKAGMKIRSIIRQSLGNNKYLAFKDLSS